MKNLVLYIFTFIGFVNLVFAQQVGINTKNPQSVLHIDGAKDNAVSGTPTQAQLYNDVLVRNDAKVGIGNMPDNNAMVTITSDTSTSAGIGMGFRLKDGTEGNGNLLSISNANGDVAWLKRVGTVQGKYNNRVVPINADLQDTGGSITLPPGKWLIRSNLLLRAQSNATGSPIFIPGNFSDGAYAKLSWADKNSDGTFSSTPDALSGNLFGGPYFSIYGLSFGQTIINNTSSTAKTYYLVTRTPVIWGTVFQNYYWTNIAGYWGETAIIAFTAN